VIRATQCYLRAMLKPCGIIPDANLKAAPASNNIYKTADL